MKCTFITSLIVVAVSAFAEADDLDTRRRSHWAWQRIGSPTPPTVKQSDWPRAAIDHFILSKLEGRGLAPTPETDRRTWLRRVTFDLTGLPPTPQEVRDFDDDSSARAYQNVVRRLLDSKHLGEHWGQHWLDLARYAETRGHEGDFSIPEAFRYRDYVIRALNADVSYDQFVIEHLAGDLVKNPRIEPVLRTNQSIQGTGFWLLGEASHSPVDIRGDEANRVANQIDVFGKTILGLTLACARCHEHKFDAISQEDYYAIYGFLQSSSYQSADVSDPEAQRRAFERARALREKSAPELFSHWVAGISGQRDGLARYLGAAAEVLAGSVADVTFTAGRIGDALTLGSRPRALVPAFAESTDDDALDFEAGDFTVSVWVNYNDTAGEQILIEKFGAGGGSPGWTIAKLGDGRLLLHSDGPGALWASSPGLVAGTWHHVVARRSGATAEFIVDGVSAGTEDYGTAAISNSPNGVLIGKRNGGELYMNGLIDEVALWGRALSDDEVSALNGGAEAGSVSEGLLAYWPLNVDGSDASGNGRDLTIQDNSNSVAKGFGGVGKGFAESDDDDALDFDGNDFTVSVWVNYKDTAGEQILVEKFTGTGGPGWTLTKLNDGRLLMHCDGAGAIRAESPGFVTGTWHHVIARRRGPNAELIVDGGTAGTADFGAKAISNSTSGVLLGKRNDGDGAGFYMNGMIDDVAMWSRALSNDEIKILQGGAEAGAVSDGLLAYWPLNFDGADVSGNDRHLALKGSSGIVAEGLGGGSLGLSLMTIFPSATTVARSRGLDARRLAGWARALLSAQGVPTDPFFGVAQATKQIGYGKSVLESVQRTLELWRLRSEASKTELWSQEVTRTIEDGERNYVSTSRKVNEADFLVDFGEIRGHGADGRRDDDWITKGHVFGDGSAVAGDVVLGRSPEQPIARVVEGSSARSDLVSRKLSGMLRTRTFEVTSDALWYRFRGKAKVFLAVDSHRVVIGPLHQVVKKTIENLTAEYAWSEHEVSDYLGHRVHIEFQPEGDFSLSAIRFCSQKPIEVFDPNVFQIRALERSPATLADLAREAISNGLEALDGLAKGKLSESVGKRDAARVANWFIAHASLLPAPGELTNRMKSRLAAYFMEHGSIEQSIPKPIYAPALLDGSSEREHVHIRGDHMTQSKSPVSRRLLSAIDPSNRELGERGSGRLELARRLVDPSNPLVSRVFVNRVWHHLFGRGLVATVDDFGVMGQRPSHPQLLDYLAAEFMRDGWSLKRLLQRLVLSSTYRMSSRPNERAGEIDPENVLLQRMRVRRLGGEAIRDSVLAISGRLDPTMFGPGVPIHITDFMSGGRAPKQSGPMDGHGRRSIYVEVRRNYLSHFLTAFDKPIPFTTIGRRNVSNSAAQPLALLNDPLVHEQAKLWAQKLLESQRDDASLVDEAYLSAFGRTPEDWERDAALAFIRERPVTEEAVDRESAWTDLCHTLFNVKEFIFIR